MTQPTPLKRHPLKKASQSWFELAEALWAHVLSIQVEGVLVERAQHLVSPSFPLKASQTN